MKIEDEKEVGEHKILRVKIKREAVSNPKSVVRYIKDADGICIKILFFLFCCDSSERDRIDVDYLAECISLKKIGTDESHTKKIANALDFWQEKKILEYSFESKKSGEIGGDIDTDGFDGSDMADIENMRMRELQRISEKSKKIHAVQPIDRLSEALETKYEFRQLVYDSQSKFGIIFNPMEINTMFNLYEVNKVDVGLLQKLVDVCVLHNKPNVLYLEKVALGLSSNGILSVRDYEKYYSELLRTKELEQKIYEIFKIPDSHKYSSKEKRFIKRWAVEFNFGDGIYEIVKEGYNICMKNLEELSFGYINGILSNWNAKGFVTLEDIRTEFNKSGEFRSTDSKSSSFNIDLFFEKAVKKAMESIEDDDDDDDD